MAEHSYHNMHQWHETYAYFDITEDRDLEDDAQVALEEFVDATTEVDYGNGNRYYIDLSDDEVTEIAKSLAHRIYDEMGNVRYKEDEDEEG